jgi:hypothetical protein
VGAFLAVGAYAQVQQAWVAKYNNGIASGTNQGVKMVLDGAGNIYVTGFSQNANGNLDYATMKYAPNGNQVWVARYVATNTTTAQPAAMVLDSQTNVIVTGTAGTVKYDKNGNQLWMAPYAGYSVTVDGTNNIFLTAGGLLKLNPTGSIIWNMTTNSSTYGPDIVVSCSLDSSGNSYVAGFYHVYYPRAYASYSWLTVAKYDPNGSQIWFEQPAYGENATPYIQSTALDQSGYFYVLVTNPSADPFAAPWGIAKYSGSNGTFVWAQGVPNNGSYYDGYDSATALTVDSVGNGFVTGGYLVMSNPYTSDPSRYGTFKFNTNGDYIATNLYPSVAHAESVGLSIAMDQANNVYVTGYSPGATTGNDIVTIKCDKNLNLIWVQRYNGPGNGDDEGNAIAVDANGNVYVSGYETTTAGGTEMVTIKYAPVPSIQKQTNGSFLLQEQGEPGESFDFQASTDLQTWLDLGSTNADTNGCVQFLDTNAPLFNQRFYLTLPQ